jgi:type VI secretion system protein ImpK
VAERTLGRIAGDLVGYVLAFHEAPHQGPADALSLRHRVLELLESIVKRPEAQSVPAADLEEARFALVAWIDEMIQGTHWPGREDWAREPLQLQLFRTNKAGDEFYERLARLHPEQLDAREVYFLCLALGFQGQYAGHDADRETLVRREYEKLRVAGRTLPVGSEPHLTPSAYDTDIELEGGRGPRTWPWLLLAAAAVGAVFAVLWLWLRVHALQIPGAD